MEDDKWSYILRTGYIDPICSVYGILTYICLILVVKWVNIPYMDPMGVWQKNTERTLNQLHLGVSFAGEGETSWGAIIPVETYWKLHPVTNFLE